MLLSRPVDAVMIPESLKRGRRSAERVGSILAVAEPLLGVDRKRGGRGYIRRTTHAIPNPDQPGSFVNLLFITANPNDTMLFPTDHPRHPEPRYRWVQDGPIRLGHLIEPPEEQVGIHRSIPR